MRLSLPSTTTLFPTYLTPSLPFRRRKSSTDSNTSASSTASSSTSTNPAQTFLGGHSSNLRCARCLSDLAKTSQIISKGFTGRHGRAYLVAPPPTSLTTPASPPARKHDAGAPNLPNTYSHKPVARNLVTGAHTVSDVSCAQCSSVLGWKYVAAEEESQRYKVGKFILETKRVCRSNCWEGDDDDDDDAAAASAIDEAGGVVGSKGDGDAEVEFDSQDEDDCEDLFLGIWTPQMAARRRQKKSFASRSE